MSGPSSNSAPCPLFLRLVLCLVACFAITGFSPANAQVPGDPPPIPKLKQKEAVIDPDDVISVNTTEVLLPVTVRDYSGQLVTGLTRTDFHVFEDGVEQPLSDLGLRQAPVDVVLLVDASSSVSENLDDFRRAAEGFAVHLAADDRISLIQFDDRVLLLQDWTNSIAQLRRALRRVAPGMFTRFNDAMLLAARDQLPRASARHAIIVLTDGIDSGRGITFDAALRAALQSQTTVYVVSNTGSKELRSNLNSRFCYLGQAQFSASMSCASAICGLDLRPSTPARKIWSN